MQHIAPTLRLLVVDDHQVVRNGIRLMLSVPNRFFQFLVEEAANGEEAYQKAMLVHYDLILMDFQLPGANAPDVITLILEHDRNTKILVLSNYNETLYIEKAVSAGAKGYLLKSVEAPELLLAIRTVWENGEYFSNEVHLKRREADNRTAAHALSRIHGLTSRELEILRLIAWGKTNRDIAKQLFVSTRTVDTHRHHLLEKLNVKNTAELIAAAARLGLVE